MNDDKIITLTLLDINLLQKSFTILYFRISDY